MKNTKDVYQKGITLIALVITIVVLLILAAVSLSFLTGDNGILTQARNSKEVNEKAEVTEKLKLEILEAQMALIEKNGKRPTIKEMAEYLEDKYENNSNIVITIEYKELAAVEIKHNDILEPKLAIIQFEGWEFKISENLQIIESYTKRIEAIVEGDDDTTYAITYDVNGGTGEIPGQNIEGNTVTLHGRSVATREGFILYKWNTAADGTGISYELGEEIQVSDIGDEITLFAHWLPVVQGAVIPDGFYYVGGTESSGVVISDDPDDENDYTGQADVGTDLEGNQFVWVPVNSTIGNNNMSQLATTEGGQALTSVTYTNTDGESVTTNVTTDRYSKLYDFTAPGTKTERSGATPGSETYGEPDILSITGYGEVARYSTIISRETGEACTSVEQVAQQYVDDL